MCSLKCICASIRIRARLLCIPKEEYSDGFIAEPSIDAPGLRYTYRKDALRVPGWAFCSNQAVNSDLWEAVKTYRCDGAADTD